MRYTDFTKNFKKPNVVESIRSYQHLIEKTEDGKVWIDSTETEFVTVEEARQHIKEEYISNKLEEEISTELYEDLSENKIASIIKEFHDIKVTDTLIENYIQLASSRIFTVDPVVQEIRKLNKLDNLVEGKLYYVLEDESIVAIDENTQGQLNNLLQNQTDVIDYMRQSKDNFMYVVKQLGE